MKQSNRNRNPKHLYYIKLLNSKEWKGVDGLRARTLTAHPLCQMCEREGIVSSSVDVHHIKPVEGVGQTYNQGEDLPEDVKAAMRQRCFDPDNVIALCIPHHIGIHRDMRSHAWQNVRAMPKDKQTKDEQQTEDWLSKVRGGTATAKPKTRKGIRRTPLGWMTKAEYHAKTKEDVESWIERMKGNK